ncbi:nitrite/sulfite reductase domain-containing protein [Orenia marismortui]|uniref:NAD(P)/FAD-dependent oxidoreductase n=1 Tax=Orenia marismortui TaxID=46469 RepID=UPI00035EDD0A|nr:NAD(P)/FAD-dependent oxidoreductase [Orenia marismortui]
MIKLPEGGNLQRIKNSKRTYSITPHISGGLTNPKTLKKIADVAEKYNCTIKITSGQQIMLIGLKAEEVDQAWDDLGMKPKNRSGLKCKGVRFCPGTSFCKRGKVDSVKLGMALENKYLGMELPSRMKMGVSGCHLSCTAPAIRDIGVVGNEEGFELRLGGSGGHKPMLAKPLANKLKHEEVLVLIDQVIDYYKDQGRVGERLGEMINRIGWEEFKKEIINKEEVKIIISAEKFNLSDISNDFNSKCNH